MCAAPWPWVGHGPGGRIRKATAADHQLFHLHDVLGQLEHPSSVPALLASMRDEGEHPMVRHEAAEALGALGDPSVMGELREMLSHPVDILRESCVVALHMYDREAFLAADEFHDVCY